MVLAAQQAGEAGDGALRVSRVGGCPAVQRDLQEAGFRRIGLIQRPRAVWDERRQRAAERRRQRIARLVGCGLDAPAGLTQRPGGASNQEAPPVAPLLDGDARERVDTTVCQGVGEEVGKREGRPGNDREQGIVEKVRAGGNSVDGGQCRRCGRWDKILIEWRERLRQDTVIFTVPARVGGNLLYSPSDPT